MRIVLDSFHLSIPEAKKVFDLFMRICYDLLAERVSEVSIQEGNIETEFDIILF
jgi:hypothetical protein